MSDEKALDVVNNAQAFKERVAESVRASFGMLIPEEDWQAMVDKEVKAFFEDTKTHFELIDKHNGYVGYGSASKKVLVAEGLTPFRVLVWEQLHKLVKPKITEYFNTHEDWMTCPEFETGQAALSDMLEKKLDDMVPLLVKSMFKGLIHAAKNEMVSDLNNRINSGQQLGEFYG